MVLETCLSFIGTPAVRCVTGLTSFFLLTWFSQKVLKFRKHRYFISIAVVAGICIFQVPLRLANPEATLVSLPIFVCQLLGVLLGWATFKAQGIVRWSTAGFAVLLGVGMFWKGMDLWLYKLNYGTFTGRVQLQPSVPLKLHDTRGEIVDLSAFRGKIVLLDFWFTNCGACFQGFPDVQKLYNRIKENPNIIFYAVDRPIPSDTSGQAVQMLLDRNYSFPLLISTDISIPDRLGVITYPTIIVMDKSQKIIYRGDLEGADKIVSKLL